MSKYKKLIANTALFGISTFSSKVLVFAMMPILTRNLGTGGYGTAQLIISTCNLLFPIVTMSIHEAVIRFGLDSEARRRDVFTTAILTMLAGYLLLLACSPLLRMIERIRDYMPLICIYALTAALRSIVTHFVRSSGFTKLFAIDGIVTTVLNFGMIVFFLYGLNMGVRGYILGVIVADACSALGLILFLKLYRFFHLRGLNRQVMKNMLRYSIPLVPTSIFWWITNLSDTFLVDHFLGEDATGLYTAAYKIPSMITLVSTIFIQAWQISAFSEQNAKENARFFSSIFKSYFTLVFVAASGLILLSKPIMVILVAEEFYESWRYVPFLVIAVAFSCMVTFLGTIYNVAKRNTMVTITTFVGAAVNVVLNLILIPKYGVNGAAFATFFSYLLVFVIRAVDTRRFIDINLHPLRIGASLILLLLQLYVGLSEFPYWIAVEIAILILLVVCNLGPILFMLGSLKRMLNRRRAVE